ncbi:MAG: hypothetical protein NW237_06070 [Cyanobacteriota bacterium]|nr:hypothetical protein [Cyanobacteriota bacterium]
MTDCSDPSRFSAPVSPSLLRVGQAIWDYCSQLLRGDHGSPSLSASPPSVPESSPQLVLDYIELNPSLLSLNWQDLPLGKICDWVAPSSTRQSEILYHLIASINRWYGRCAVIDQTQQFSTSRWKLLSRSGRNWLIEPDTTRLALQSTLMLLLSSQFSLIVLPGMSIDELHPADVLCLQAALSPHSTLLFMQNIPTDFSGEPYPLLSVDPRDPRCA